MPYFFLAQALTADDIAAEIARVQRNFEFLSYGLLAAWIILAVYALMLAARERRLKAEIARLKAMIEQREAR